MKVSEAILSTIYRLPNGYVFTCNDFDKEVERKEAVIKALNRLVATEKIVKLAKGKFYKPQITPFGKLQPSEEQMIKDLLVTKGKVSGYLTGYSMYNKFGLTTQISNTIQIGKNEIRPRLKRGYLSISFIKQRNAITKDNIPLLQILDAIRYVKKIPDTTIAAACKRLLVIIGELSEQDRKRMISLTLKYPPSTRALVGALMEEIGCGALVEPLWRSLNPITVYRFSAINKVLSGAEKWNIQG